VKKILLSLIILILFHNEVISQGFSKEDSLLKHTQIDQILESISFYSVAIAFKKNDIEAEESKVEKINGIKYIIDEKAIYDNGILVLIHWW